MTVKEIEDRIERIKRHVKDEAERDALLEYWNERLAKLKKWDEQLTRPKKGGFF